MNDMALIDFRTNRQSEPIRFSLKQYIHTQIKRNSDTHLNCINYNMDEKTIGIQ